MRLFKYNRINTFEPNCVWFYDTCGHGNGQNGEDRHEEVERGRKKAEAAAINELKAKARLRL